MTEPLPEDDIVARRRALRNRVVAEREALTATARHALTHRLEAHLAALLDHIAPTVLGFCWPFRGEPDLQRFVTRWLAADRRRVAALPVVLDRDVPLVFRRWTPETVLVPDRHGIPHPPVGDTLHPDAVLVPLNAFDAAGFRLGYGGGYFDRTLAVLETCAIGVGFELGRVESVFPRPHDQRMDWIVTEAETAQPRNMR